MHTRANTVRRAGKPEANINDNILTVVPQEANVTLNITVTVSDGNTTHSVFATKLRNMD